MVFWANANLSHMHNYSNRPKLPLRCSLRGSSLWVGANFQFWLSVAISLLHRMSHKISIRQRNESLVKTKCENLLPPIWQHVAQAKLILKFHRRTKHDTTLCIADISFGKENEGF